MSLFVDQDALRGEALKLAEASVPVDELAATLPVDVDGGIGTAAILGILAIFAESGGELASALAGLGDVLTECVDLYSGQDLAAADALNSASWTE